MQAVDEGKAGLAKVFFKAWFLKVWFLHIAKHNYISNVVNASELFNRKRTTIVSGQNACVH